jgi:hypothetical protein
MKFKPGQKVVFLNEVGGGIVQSINDQGQYLVEDADGFTQRYLESQLAPVLGEDYKIGDDDIAIIKEEASKTKVSHTSHREYDKKSIRGFEVWEIDLHIEEIVDSHAALTNAEILKKQMNAFKIFFNKARSQSIRKMIVIHGVGEGVLKFEVRNFLAKIDGIEYYDSDYVDYGKGATTIEVHSIH